MTVEQTAAYIMAQTECCASERAGMQARNDHNKARGLAPAYGQRAFDALPEKYGIHSNAVLGFYGSI